MEQAYCRGIHRNGETAHVSSPIFVTVFRKLGFGRLYWKFFMLGYWIGNHLFCAYTKFCEILLFLKKC